MSAGKERPWFEGALANGSLRRHPDWRSPDER